MMGSEGKYLSPGYTVQSRFRIVALIGEGSFASAYEAFDTVNDLRCVVRVHKSDLGESFLEYAHHLEAIGHKLASFATAAALPYYTGQDAGHSFQVFEFIPEVVSVATSISEERPTLPATALGLISRVAEALAPLHDRDVIHADLKPSNILTVGGLDGPVPSSILA